MKIKTVGKLPIILDKFIEYIPNLIKENWRMSTCNQLDLQTLGSQPIMPKNLPGHCSSRALDHRHNGEVPFLHRIMARQQCQCVYT